MSRQSLTRFRFSASVNRQTEWQSANGNSHTRLTVADVIDWYLAHAAGELAPSTFASERSAQLAFAKECGTLAVTEAKPFHLADWISSHKTWKSSCTRQSMAARIRAAFGAATRLGKITHDPFKGVSYRAADSRPPIVTADHLKAMSACRHDQNFSDMLEFLYATGVRPDELVSLRWTWIHLDASFISLPEHKTSKRTGAPRDLVITPPLRAILERAKLRQPLSELVFLTQTNKAWKVSNSLRIKWQRIRAKARLADDIVLYSYRHSVATRMIAAGVPDLVVAKALGHSDTRTLGKYAHPRVEDMTNAFLKAADTTL